MEYFVSYADKIKSRSLSESTYVTEEQAGYDVAIDICLSEQASLTDMLCLIESTNELYEETMQLDEGFFGNLGAKLDGGITHGLGKIKSGFNAAKAGIAHGVAAVKTGTTNTLNHAAHSTLSGISSVKSGVARGVSAVKSGAQKISVGIHNAAAAHQDRMHNVAAQHSANTMIHAVHASGLGHALANKPGAFHKITAKAMAGSINDHHGGGTFKVAKVKVKGTGEHQFHVTGTNSAGHKELHVFNHAGEHIGTSLMHPGA